MKLWAAELDLHSPVDHHCPNLHLSPTVEIILVSHSLSQSFQTKPSFIDNSYFLNRKFLSGSCIPWCPQMLGIYRELTLLSTYFLPLRNMCVLLKCGSLHPLCLPWLLFTFHSSDVLLKQLISLLLCYELKAFATEMFNNSVISFSSPEAFLKQRCKILQRGMWKLQCTSSGWTDSFFNLIPETTMLFCIFI